MKPLLLKIMNFSRNGEEYLEGDEITYCELTVGVLRCFTLFLIYFVFAATILFFVGVVLAEVLNLLHIIQLDKPFADIGATIIGCIIGSVSVMLLIIACEWAAKNFSFKKFKCGKFKL